MAYVYRHIRLDKNEVFYVGVSLEKDVIFKRAFKRHGRNIYWNRIANSTEILVEIIMDNLTDEAALLKEVEFITLYGLKIKKQGTLVNLTAGGKGNVGYKLSDESKMKISLKNKGKKHTPEAIEKIRKSGLGNKYTLGRKLSDSHRKQISEANKGKPQSEALKLALSKVIRKGYIASQATREKLSLKAKGRPCKPETIEKLKIKGALRAPFMSGKNSPMYGTKMPREHLKRLTEIHSKPVIQYTLQGEFVREFESIMEAHRTLRIPQSNISYVCMGKRKKAGKFIWKLKTEL